MINFIKKLPFKFLIVGFINTLFAYLFGVITYYLFYHSLGIIVVGILNSVVSLFYYFNIARSMWLDEPDDDSKINPHPAISVIIIICTIPTILFGIKWGILHDFIYNSILF